MPKGDDPPVDLSAHFYKATAIDRNGKHVWLHDLFNMDCESNIVRYQFPIPNWVKPPLELTAT